MRERGASEPDAPFLRRLGLPLGDGRDRVVLDDRVEGLGDVVVVEPSSAPTERRGRLLAHEADVDEPERLGDERLHALVLVDDEAEGRELARTCARTESAKSARRRMRGASEDAP